MKYSAKTGFYVPEVMDTCINCGKCVAFCPALKKDKKRVILVMLKQLVLYIVLIKKLESMEHLEAWLMK